MYSYIFFKRTYVITLRYIYHIWSFERIYNTKYTVQRHEPLSRELGVQLTTPRAPRKILRSRDKFANHFLKWLINFGEKKNIFLYFK